MDVIALRTQSDLFFDTYVAEQRLSKKFSVFTLADNGVKINEEISYSHNTDRFIRTLSNCIKGDIVCGIPTYATLGLDRLRLFHRTKVQDILLETLAECDFSGLIVPLDMHNSWGWSYAAKFISSGKEVVCVWPQALMADDDDLARIIKHLPVTKFVTFRQLDTDFCSQNNLTVVPANNLPYPSVKREPQTDSLRLLGIVGENKVCIHYNPRHEYKLNALIRGLVHQGINSIAFFCNTLHGKEYVQRVFPQYFLIEDRAMLDEFDIFVTPDSVLGARMITSTEIQKI